MTTDNYQNALDALSGALLEVDRQKRLVAGLKEDGEHLANVAMGTAMALGMVAAEVVRIERIGGDGCHCHGWHGPCGCGRKCSDIADDVLTFLSQSPEAA